MKKVLFFVFFCLFSSSLYSEDFSVKKINEIVDSYYEVQELGVQDQERVRDCRPVGSCFQTACESVRRFECNSQSDMDRLKKACRGSWGDGCLKTSMNFLNSFEYNNLHEMEELAKSCRGVYDVQCIQYTCNRLGSFSCRRLDQIVQINKSCAGM